MPCSACANARRRTKPYTPLSSKSDAKAKAAARRTKAVDIVKKEQERQVAARKEQERQERERREKFAQKRAALQHQRNRAIAWQRAMAMARQRAIAAGAQCMGRSCTANKRKFRRMNLTRR